MTWQQCYLQRGKGKQGKTSGKLVRNNKIIKTLKSKHITQYLLLNAEALFHFYPMYWAETLEKIKDKILRSFLISKVSPSSGLMTCTAESCLGQRDETITCSRLSVWCWTTPWSWTFPRSAPKELCCIFVCLDWHSWMWPTKQLQLSWWQLKVVGILLGMFHICQNIWI